ncbi:MAG: DUF2950 domain-containing protein [Candidatus Xenobiia bacterium LiM19]
MKKNSLDPYRVIACAAVILLLVQAAVAPAFAQGKQKTFATPDEAIRVLLDAFKTHNVPKLIEIVGADNKDLVVTHDTAQDAYGRKKICQMASERLVKEKKGNSIVFVMGKNEWLFPFPLVKEGAGWRFDGKAGREEVINRRVGKDELNAIACCRYYIKAQREYAGKDRNNDDVMEYAQKIASTKGKKDGLFWPSAGSNDVSPFESLFEKSRKYALARRQGEPFYGYYFKPLTKQGENAPGGAHDYIINGHQVAGCGLIAYPSSYGVSGVATFIINQRGKVYEKDLGADTVKIASEMTEYNPDKTWKMVKENGSLATD